MLDGVTILPNCAFCCFSSLRYIAIPSSVECIEYDAFYNCTSLINIIISSNIKKIGFDAFYNCTSLVIYCEVESKPSGWYDEFWYNSNRPIYWGIAKEDIIDQDGMQFIIQDNKAILTRYIGNNKDLTIPSSITIQDKEYSVILGKYAFCNTNVENIIIEDGINIIPD